MTISTSCQNKWLNSKTLCIDISRYNMWKVNISFADLLKTKPRINNNDFITDKNNLLKISWQWKKWCLSLQNKHYLGNGTQLLTFLSVFKTSYHNWKWNYCREISVIHQWTNVYISNIQDVLHYIDKIFFSNWFNYFEFIVVGKFRNISYIYIKEPSGRSIRLVWVSFTKKRIVGRMKSICVNWGQKLCWLLHIWVDSICYFSAKWIKYTVRFISME